MESSENPIFGRKVFFLNPSLNIRNVVVERLRSLEYEVYTMESYKEAKAVLRENEHAICFINIDDSLSMKEWFNFVKSFEFDDSLSTVFLGVISAKANIVEKEQFIMKTKLPGGFIDLNKPIAEVFLTIQKILDLNGSKGRRKYVRLDYRGSNELTANCLVNQRLVDLVLNDLSSCGFAARVKSSMASLFVKDCDYVITLHLLRKDLVVKSKVFAIKPIENEVIIVFILDESIPYTINEEIRQFVFRTLQERMDEHLKSSMKDYTDYTQDIKVPEENKEKLLSLDDIKFDELSDLEEP